MIKQILTTGLCGALVLTLYGCGSNYGQYAQAISEQNVTRQLSMNSAAKEREYSQQQHEYKMAKLTGELLLAAGKTESPNDDMMVPLIMLMMEDKWAMVNATAQANAPREQLAVIRPPDTIGDTIKKSTGAILGIGGIWLGITQSNNIADVAVAGINGAGTHNNVSGESNTLNSASNNTDTNSQYDNSYNSADTSDSSAYNNTDTASQYDNAYNVDDNSDNSDNSNNSDNSDNSDNRDNSQTGTVPVADI